MLRIAGYLWVLGEALLVNGGLMDLLVNGLVVDEMVLNGYLILSCCNA